MTALQGLDAGVYGLGVEPTSAAQFDPGRQRADVHDVPARGKFVQQGAEWEEMTDRRRGVCQYYRHRARPHTFGPIRSVRDDECLT
jgi:hypothetical protein